MLRGVREFVARGGYFVVHAPRQTGKTTALQALVSEINAKGDMAAMYCTLEAVQGATDPDKRTYPRSMRSTRRRRGSGSRMAS